MIVNLAIQSGTSLRAPSTFNSAYFDKQKSIRVTQSDDVTLVRPMGMPISD